MLTVRDLVMIVAGILLGFLILGVLVPDKWAMSFVSRKNVPRWVALLGAFILVPSLGLVLKGYGLAIFVSVYDTISRVHVDWWLRDLLFVGAICLIIWFLFSIVPKLVSSFVTRLRTGRNQNQKTAKANS